MGLTQDTIVRGHQFEGGTGHKSAENLEDLVTRATLAAGSELLDQASLETFLDEVLSVYRARIKDGGVTTAKLAAAAVTADKMAPGLALPSGFIGFFGMEIAPSGWLECDGAAVSRSTYAALFSAIGTAYGIGDGSTTFNVPDSRGMFPRGWNHGKTTGKFDTDAATRTAVNGGNAGDRVGSDQDESLKTHAHSYYNPPDGVAGISGGYPGMVRNQLATTGATGGTETRPKNFSGMFCIKT